MPRRHPLTAIFNPEARRGSVNPGAMIGAVRPTVTINKAAGQEDPTRWPIVDFDIHFSEPVTGLVAADITVVTSNGYTPVKNLTGSGQDYVFSVKYLPPFNTVVQLSGTITATIAAGVATGTVSGLTNEASTSTDNVITYNADFIPIASNGLILTSRAYQGMVKIGNHLFIAENNGNRLLSVDVSTPSAYTVTQTLTPIPATAPGSGNATNPQGVDTDGTQVFLSSVWQVRAMNVTNPAAMTTTGTTVTESTNLNRGESLIYDADYCYVANVFGDRFTVVDVNPAATPAVVGSVTDATFLIDPRLGCKIGNYVFVNSTYGVVAIDVTTPSAPAVADAINGLSVFAPVRGAMCAMGDYVLFAGGSNHLYIIDATDPTNLSIACDFTMPGLTTNFIQDSNFYVVTPWDTNVVLMSAGLGAPGLVLLDVTDPTDPQIISASPGLYDANNFQVILHDDPYVYSLHANNGLLVEEYVGP